MGSTVFFYTSYSSLRLQLVKCESGSCVECKFTLNETMQI